MAKIIRSTADEASAQPKYRINLNITLNGSKKLTAEEQEETMQFDDIRVLIYGGADKTQFILVDQRIPAKAFNSGSVGYGLQGTAEFVEPRLNRKE